MTATGPEVLSREDLGPIGFGAMRLTGPSVLGPPKDPVAARRVVDLVVERGVRLIDTADAYGPGTCEELIGQALARHRDRPLVATKGGFVRSPEGGWNANGRPEHLRAACDASLRRLGSDCIDIYQLHTPDPAVPIEESVGALGELRRAGKVRFIGVSNVDVEQLAAAVATEQLSVVQNLLNLDERSSVPVVRRCEELGIAFLAHTPLNKGEASPETAALAKGLGFTAAQLGLAWLRAQSPAVLPIPGTRSVAHLEENLAAARIELDTDTLRQLDGAPLDGVWR